MSIVAAQAGLKPLAMDYEPEALEFVRLNARLNDAEQTAALVMDWRTQALKSGCVSLVCAADILYERRFVQPVADFLDHVLGEDGVVLLADPMRNFLQDFDERMNSLGFESRTLSNDSVACEGYEVRIRLREHRRKSRPAT